MNRLLPPWPQWACALLLALLPLAARAEQLTITMLDHGQLLEQVTRAVLIEAYGKLDVAVRFKEVPAARALAESASGLADGEMHRMPGLSAQYPTLVQVNVPVNWFDAVVVTRSVRFVPRGWKSLRPYSIGFHRGIQAFERGTRGMTVDRAPNNELMLRKLQSGRTQIVIMTDVEARDMLARLDDASLLILAPPLERIELFHYLHISRASLVPRLEAVLRRMAADGSIAAIRERIITRARAEP